MRLKKKIYILLAFSFSIIWMLAAGQNSTPFVEKKVGADSINLGSQTSILFSVATPGDYLWQWPELVDKLTEKVEIVSHTGIDTARQRRSDLLLLTKQLMVTSFDTGYNVIPPFTFQYKVPGDTIWTTLETEPSLLYVAGPDVDLASPIRDIKGPLNAPVTFMEVLPWLLLAIFIVAGILLYRHYLKKKRTKISLVPKQVRPKIPPHTKALNALEQLRHKKLWQSGMVKAYHSEITDILRHYLEERYQIMAVEMTTSEIMEAAHEHTLPSQAKENLLMIFTRADLVKFAKSIPLAGEHEESFMLAVDFVRATIPLAIEEDYRDSSGKKTKQVM